MPRSILNQQDVLKLFDDTQIAVFEGFEMTGKSYFLNELKKSEGEISNISYRPDWEGILDDEVCRRGNRHIPGISILDFLVQNPDILHKKRLLLDRWMAVSYVYRKMYKQPTDIKHESKFLKILNSLADTFEITFFHKCHKDLGEAERLHELAKSGSKHVDTYDNFSSFQEYWNKYLLFEDSYTYFYDNFCDKVNVIKLSSFNNDILSFEGRTK